MDIAKSILVVIGIVILVPGFAMQLLKVYRKDKNTNGISMTSWLLNFIGRFLWIPYAGLAYAGDWTGIVMLVGQAIAAGVTIPIIYYVKRNEKTDGMYVKEHFKRHYFGCWMAGEVIVLFTAIMFILINQDVFGIVQRSGYEYANAIDMMQAGEMLDIPFTPAIEGSQHGFYTVWFAGWFSLVFGLVATFFTGIAFLPQTIRTFKTKNTKNTSLMLTVMFTVGNFILTIYMILKMVQDGANWYRYIGSIILVCISVSLMGATATLKIHNIRAGIDPLHDKRHHK